MPPVASPDTTCWMKISTVWSSVAEVRAPDRVVLLEFSGRPRHDDAPGLEQIRVVRQIERDRCVLLDEQHAHPLFVVDAAHDAEDLPHDQRRQAERGLV